MIQNTQNLTDPKLYQNIQLQKALAQKELLNISTTSQFVSRNLDLDYVRDTAVDELYKMLENTHILIKNLTLQIHASAPRL